VVRLNGGVGSLGDG